jgi:outer membrane lipoprotein-sorting protein
VRQFEYTEPNGLVRRVTIEKLVVNPAVAGSAFEFEVPKGVRVVEG